MFDIVFENESPKAKIEAPKNISCLALLRYFVVSPWTGTKRLIFKILWASSRKS